MSHKIYLPGLKAETLLGFLAALGTLRLIARSHADAKLSWSQSGGGWTASLHFESGSISDANAVAEAVFLELEQSKSNHPIFEWERFLSKTFSDEHLFLQSLAFSSLKNVNYDQDYTALFTTQLPVRQGEVLEHFDQPFRAARRDYYPGNLKSVVQNTELSHIVRVLCALWDYRDAMANQSLRLDHGDDRRHAYQWYAPTADPARQKSGCMLGANRLAIEAFPLFPCIPAASGNTAVGFASESKTWTWVSWPIWTAPCSLSVISSLINLAALQKSKIDLAVMRRMGVVAVLRSRRLPVEKNKVFLPPVSLESTGSDATNLESSSRTA